VGRIVLEINVVEDGVHIQPVPYRWVGEGVANTHAHQVARELLKYFQALLKENPDATAVADALSHEQSGIGPIQGRMPWILAQEAKGLLDSLEPLQL
jgi:butyrate kinase